MVTNRRIVALGRVQGQIWCRSEMKPVGPSGVSLPEPDEATGAGTVKPARG
jgi:hypothetical protein